MWVMIEFCVCNTVFVWFKSFLPQLVFMKFIPFYHRSWVCSGNIEVFHSVNGTHRQPSHSRNSCSPFQIRAGISGSSLFSEERLHITSSIYAIGGLSHGNIVPWAEVRKEVWGLEREWRESLNSYLQCIMVLFENDWYFLYNIITWSITAHRDLLTD